LFTELEKCDVCGSPINTYESLVDHIDPPKIYTCDCRKGFDRCDNCGRKKRKTHKCKPKDITYAELQRLNNLLLDAIEEASDIMVIHENKIGYDNMKPFWDAYKKLKETLN